MSRFIAMPWDDRLVRWSPEEVSAAVALRADGLSHNEIADKLAERGFPPRDDTCVKDKLARLEGRRR